MNDINFDDLDDFDSVKTTKPEARTEEEHKRARDFGGVTSESTVARYEETCKACRGTGKFRSYTGRVVGDCFKCNGTGKRVFRTSPETRQQANEQAKAKRVAKKMEKLNEVEAWMDANPERTEFLKQDWDFPRSLMTKLIKYGSLTEGQIAAIDKCLAKQAARAAKKAEQQKDSIEAGLDLSEVISGLYSAEGVTLKIDNIEKGGKWFGWVFVKTEDGDRVGSQRPHNEYRGGQVEALKVIAADPLAAAIAYGKETGTCGCCGRTLTNPDSIEAGIGPICAAKYA